MGSSEVYETVGSHADVVGSLVVEDGLDATSARLLFLVVPRHRLKPEDEMRRALKALIRERISPRRVPDEILEIAEVPRTLNGKKLEVPVKRLLHSARSTVSRGSVANPDPWSRSLGSACRPAPKMRSGPQWTTSLARSAPADA